jgi:hypothetical protein
MRELRCKDFLEKTLQRNAASRFLPVVNEHFKYQMR